MSDQNSSFNNNSSQNSLIVAEEPTAQLQAFEEGLISWIKSKGLPFNNVFVPIDQRIRVFKNADQVIAGLPPNAISEAIYISKFLAAAASGLFDAALNYLWDQTVLELRKRVATYDLSYFFDVAVPNSDRRKQLHNEADLIKIDDYELITGAKEIGLISDVGYKHLDFIRYMRNWASAAHPNQNTITGLQLVTWLETCIQEVIALPQSKVVVEIKKLLNNIRTNALTSTDAVKIGNFLAKLDQTRITSLAFGLFGLYCDPYSVPQVRENITLFFPRLWPLIPEETRRALGVKYAQYVANGDADRQRLARAILEVLKAAPYIPDGILAAEVDAAIADLWGVHQNLNNFYNEPAFAKRLAALVPESGAIPLGISSKYVAFLAAIFLSNGNGIAWNADPIYRALLSRFDEYQATSAIMSFSDDFVSSRLQFNLCQQKFRELLSIMRPKITNQLVLDLINTLETFQGPLSRAREDVTIIRRMDAIRQVLG